MLFLTPVIGKFTRAAGVLFTILTYLPSIFFFANQPLGRFLSPSSSRSVHPTALMPRVHHFVLYSLPPRTYILCHRRPQPPAVPAIFRANRPFSYHQTHKYDRRWRPSPAIRVTPLSSLYPLEEDYQVANSSFLL